MRLLTRADFDGLGCAAVLKDRGIITEWLFVDPSSLQNGAVEVTQNDVLANVPYVKGCRMWFDHHISESERLPAMVEFEGESRIAPSAARIVYDYFGGSQSMPHFEELISNIDKLDSGMVDLEEIMNPTGWVLLGFIADPATRLWAWDGFQISHEKLMEKLMNYCKVMSIEDILALPDIKERIAVYMEQSALYQEMLKQCTVTEKNLIITDLRGREKVAAGNRFVVYALYPGKNISVTVTDDGDLCKISAGYSVLNRTANTNIGRLMLKYGGGGHLQAGSCYVPREKIDGALSEIKNTILMDG